MELINATRMAVGFTMGMEPSGRELLVVAIKATFDMPVENGGKVRLADEQQPLILADVFHGEPGLSAPKYETDYPPRKQRCDVLLNATAHAPEGRPVERLIAGVRIGGWQKTVAVVGDRVWNGKGGLAPTPVQPFTTMPINYDAAFGGFDDRHEDPAQHAAYLRNPSGRGFAKHLVGNWLHGLPLPNVEEPDNPVTRPDGNYAPMAFGPIGRHWAQRVRFAGTYDQRWLDHVAPFLPADFDERYYQSAPEDQQIALPVGEQEVTLLNLAPSGRSVFVLPHLEAPVVVVPKRGPREELLAFTDTILIEPDAQRVSLTWRVARPLRKNMFEIDAVLVGRKGPQWWQERERVPFPIPIVAEKLEPQSAEGVT